MIYVLRRKHHSPMLPPTANIGKDCFMSLEVQWLPAGKKSKTNTGLVYYSELQSSRCMLIGTRGKGQNMRKLTQQSSQESVKTESLVSTKEKAKIRKIVLLISLAFSFNFLSFQVCLYRLTTPHL